MLLTILKTIGLCILIVGCIGGVFAIFACAMSSDVSRMEEEGTAFVDDSESYMEGNLYD